MKAKVGYVTLMSNSDNIWEKRKTWLFSRLYNYPESDVYISAQRAQNLFNGSILNNILDSSNNISPAQPIRHLTRELVFPPQTPQHLPRSMLTNTTTPSPNISIPNQRPKPPPPHRRIHLSLQPRINPLLPTPLNLLLTHALNAIITRRPYPPFILPSSIIPPSCSPAISSSARACTIPATRGT